MGSLWTTATKKKKKSKVSENSLEIRHKLEIKVWRKSNQAVNFSVNLPESMKIWSHIISWCWSLVQKEHGPMLNQVYIIYSLCILFVDQWINPICYYYYFGKLLPTQRKKQFIWIHFAFLCKVISIKQKKGNIILCTHMFVPNFVTRSPNISKEPSRRAAQ